MCLCGTWYNIRFVITFDDIRKSNIYFKDKAATKGAVTKAKFQC